MCYIFDVAQWLATNVADFTGKQFIATLVATDGCVYSVHIHVLTYYFYTHANLEYVTSTNNQYIRKIY